MDVLSTLQPDWIAASGVRKKWAVPDTCRHTHRQVQETLLAQGQQGARGSTGVDTKVGLVTVKAVVDTDG